MGFNTIKVSQVKNRTVGKLLLLIDYSKNESSGEIFNVRSFFKLRVQIPKKLELLKSTAMLQMSKRLSHCRCHISSRDFAAVEIMFKIFLINTLKVCGMFIFNLILIRKCPNSKRILEKLFLLQDRRRHASIYFQINLFLKLRFDYGKCNSLTS